MRLTERQLRKIIKEEKDRAKVIDQIEKLINKLLDAGISKEEVVEELEDLIANVQES